MKSFKLGGPGTPMSAMALVGVGILSCFFVQTIGFLIILSGFVRSIMEIRRGRRWTSVAALCVSAPFVLLIPISLALLYLWQ